MNMRITTTTDGERTVIQIDGRLQAVDIPELDKEIDSVDRRLVLDLSELQSAVPAGIERLRKLAAEGAEFRGASPYVQMLLDNGGHNAWRIIYLRPGRTLDIEHESKSFQAATSGKGS